MPLRLEGGGHADRARVVAGDERYPEGVGGRQALLGTELAGQDIGLVEDLVQGESVAFPPRTDVQPVHERDGSGDRRIRSASKPGAGGYDPPP